MLTQAADHVRACSCGWYVCFCVMPCVAGWNACSSCFGDASKKRQYLILPALKSGRVYGEHTGTGWAVRRRMYMVQKA